MNKQINEQCIVFLYLISKLEGCAFTYVDSRELEIEIEAKARSRCSTNTLANTRTQSADRRKDRKVDLLQRSTTSCVGTQLQLSRKRHSLVVDAVSRRGVSLART